MVTPQSIAASLNPLYQLERVLSGIQLLANQGNSLRQIARVLAIPEGTLRRTFINQERAPSQASLDRVYNRFQELGTIIRVPGANTTTYIPIAPGAAAIENISRITPGQDLRIVFTVPPEDPLAAVYTRGFRTLGKLRVPYDETLADKVTEAGYDPNLIAKIVILN